MCFAILKNVLYSYDHSNKSPTRCNNFPVYYRDVYLQLNMFRAFSRPSSGAFFRSEKIKKTSQKGVLYLHFCKYLKVQFPELLSRRTIFRIEFTVQNKADNLLIHVLESLAVPDDINP